MDPALLRERCKTVRVFARVMPEQKLALVEALKASDMIVAMTGDGINDAPALKAAQVGLAMGKRAQMSPREAADIVLLDDSFPSIVGGIRLGRQIFANLRKALIFITAIHIPIAGLALLPLLFALPPLFFPCTSFCSNSPSTPYAHWCLKPSHQRLRSCASLHAKMPRCSGDENCCLASHRDW